MDGITKVTSFEQLPGLIADFGEIDNIHSCAAYLQTIRDIGFEIDLFYLMAKAEKILGGKEQSEEKFEKNMEELKKFYYFGYRKWNEVKRENAKGKTT